MNLGNYVKSFWKPVQIEESKKEQHLSLQIQPEIIQKVEAYAKVLGIISSESKAINYDNDPSSQNFNLDEVINFLKDFSNWNGLPKKINNQIQTYVNKINTAETNTEKYDFLREVLRFIIDQIDLDFLEKENGHVLAIRPFISPARKFNEENLLNTMIETYHHAIFKAMLLTVGVNLIDLPTKDSSVYRFARDPALIIPNRMIITTEGNERDHCMDIVTEVKKFDYEHIRVQDDKFEVTRHQTEHVVIKDAYMEGGNVIFDPNIGEGVLFHGMNPDSTGYRKDSTPFNYSISPQQTNQQLKDQLTRKYGIQIHGLLLDPKMLTTQDCVHFPLHFRQSPEPVDDVTRYVPAHFYYHLDCFMQLLPSGDLIILNKKMLSNESLLLLHKFYGNRIIDLAYEEYIRRPVFFNFVATTKDKKIVIISPPIPDTLFRELNKLGFIVITPDRLDPNSVYFNENFAFKVALHLKKMGFETADSSNLTTKLAICSKGYLGNGRRFTVRGELSQDKHKIYGRNEINFCFYKGGPHCLTSELIQCRSLVQQSQANSSSAPKSTL